MSAVLFVEAVRREQAEPSRDVCARFEEVLTALYGARFTGRVWVDFAEGQPKRVSLLHPVSVTIRN